ncbi:hypothetical protein PHLGIDRAFT_512563 [Phlebiopsis gigantea 11061_1 CR5-6]|uniref:Uncharacterized protein n=1 Tax=Phlebiopsis gigantea (strain 11061_1 CR5-6) TaxID=745531 RepID=A0A0C3NQD8_PHLG1|nr:hypothetical protein PHLGIDRAFT_512563 [Phlebiopsis gigantea 11061_1 CR5-6]
MDWSNGADGEHDHTQDLHTPPITQRGNSLDSSQIFLPTSLQRPPPPLALFDDPLYTDGCDFVPSSPHIQLLPSDEGDALLIMGLVSEPAAMRTATITPALLRLSLVVGGLGLDVDVGLDRSPSPSDYEVQLLKGYDNAAASELPEDEFRQPRASEDAAVIRAWWQEYHAATELWEETRRAWKEEKHRLRELGAPLDLKLANGSGGGARVRAASLVTFSRLSLRIQGVVLKRMVPLSPILGSYAE